MLSQFKIATKKSETKPTTPLLKKEEEEEELPKLNCILF